MHALIYTWFACVGVAWTGVALAAPKVDARAKHKLAVQLDHNGEAEKALGLIEEGLALAPKDLALLELKGRVLLKLRDYTGALAAYQAYLDAGAKGANRRQAQNIVEKLGAVQSTFLDVTLANGPAEIYLDSKTQGVFCTAAPSCTKPVLPGEYKVIVERSGFERWTGRVTIEGDKTTPLPITLVEEPSLLTVRVAQPGARVTVDDTAYDAPATVAAGTHRVVVSLAGHMEERREIVAHEGKPVELDVPLTPLVAVHLEPPGAALRLDGKPVAIQDGGLAIPPDAHVLVARAQGFEDRRIDIPAERAPDYQLTIELARVEVRTNAVPQPVTPDASMDSVTGRGQGMRIAGLATGGVGALGLGIGVVFGLKARSLSNEASSWTAYDRSRDDQGKAYQRDMFVFTGIGAAALVGGGILYYLGHRAEQSADPGTLSFAPSIGPSQIAFTVASYF